jgi:hypothetical protein
MLALPALLLAGLAALQRVVIHCKSPRRLIVIGVVLLLALLLLCFPRFLEMPWLGNLLTPQGIMGRIEILGHRPTVLPLWFRRTIAAIVWIVTATILADGFASLPYSREALKRIRDRIAGIPLAAICIIILAAAYTAVLLSRTGRDLVFDRYALPLVPLLAIPALLVWQEAPLRAGLRRPAWRIAVLALGIYTLYAIAATQEVLALARARAEVMRRLESAGAAATDVDDGIEQMAWSHLEVVGHINNPDIQNPPNAFQKGESYTPSIRDRFEVDASPDLRPSSVYLGGVEYFSLLPPLHRWIYIYQPGPQANAP